MNLAMAHANGGFRTKHYSRRKQMGSSPLEASDAAREQNGARDQLRWNVFPKSASGAGLVNLSPLVRGRLAHPRTLWG